MNGAITCGSPENAIAATRYCFGRRLRKRRTASCAAPRRVGFTSSANIDPELSIVRTTLACSLGTPDGQVTISRGGFERTIPVPPDPYTLRAIARTTGGQFFEAKDDAKLNQVYESLGSRLGRTKKKREATYAFLGGSAALLLAAGLLSVRWVQRLP